MAVVNALFEPGDVDGNNIEDAIGEDLADRDEASVCGAKGDK